MNLSRLFVSMYLLMAAVSVSATEADGIRKELEHAQGKEKLELLSRLYDLSLEGDDYRFQWQCVNDYLTECRKQGNSHEESYARWNRILLFYNNDQNDSVIHYAPDDILFIRDHGEREKFYDTWSCLVNTYVYNGSLATGLKEAENMYQFAKDDKDDFGSGLACYVMGNAYYNMNNLDEAAAINRQGIEILMRQKPVSQVLSELFYPRDRKTKVYLGEYASKDKKLIDALAEGLYLLHVERNADVVTMTSYAPLFARKDATNWNPDLIYFDNEKPYLTCSYYVQQMFGLSSGDYYYGDCVTFNRQDDNLLGQSVIYDSKTKKLYVKICNAGAEAVQADINLSRFKIKGNVEKTVITGKPDDENNYDAQPIVPVKETSPAKKKMKVEVQPYSITMWSFLMK